MLDKKIASIAFTFGCPRSEVDTALLYRYLKKNQWNITDNIGKAHLVIASGCGFNIEYEQRSLKLLERLAHRIRKDSLFIIVGCLAGINPKILYNKFNCSVVSPKNLSMIDTIIDAAVPIEEIPEINDHTPYIVRARNIFRLNELIQTRSFSEHISLIPSYVKKLMQPIIQKDQTRNIYYLKLGRGCLDECSYCAIRFSCGILVSKPMKKVIQKFRDGLLGGYRRFQLILGDIGAYGQDKGSNIVELFKKLLEVDGDYQFILDDFNMRWCHEYEEELLEIFSIHRHHFEQIGIPVQSGSNVILKSMKRHYTAQDALKFNLKLHKLAPNIRLSTHILIGFPGETEKELSETVSFLKATYFDEIYFYIYQDRPNTNASNLPGKVNEIEKKRRKECLLNAWKGGDRLSVAGDRYTKVFR